MAASFNVLQDFTSCYYIQQPTTLETFKRWRKNVEYSIMEMMWDAIKCCFLGEFSVLWIQWLINCDMSSGKFEEKQVHAKAGNTFHYPQTQFSHIEINFLSGFVQLTPNLDHKMNSKSRIRRGDITQVLTQAHLYSWDQLKTLLSSPDKTCIYELTHCWCLVIIIWNYFRYLSVYNGEGGSSCPLTPAWLQLSCPIENITIHAELQFKMK